MMSSIQASPPLPQPQGYTSIAGAAAFSSLSAKSVRKLIDDKVLTVSRVGGRILISYEELNRVIRSKAG